MAGDEHKLFASVKAGYVVSCILEHVNLLIDKCLVALEFIHYHLEGINHGIAGDEDVFGDAFGFEVPEGCRTTYTSKPFA